MAVPSLVIITVHDVASLGASNGIMVRSGGSMGLYYDQIFSLVEFLVLDFLSMAATGFYVFGMSRIYLEQEKSGRYHSQIAVYKMLAEQYRQSERLRHDMKNHIIALSALSRNKEWERVDGYQKNMESIVLDAGGDMTERYAEGFMSKRDSREHGIGLLNVGDVVNKYNGAVSTEAGNGIFAISILMPLNDTAHDIKTAV